MVDKPLFQVDHLHSGDRLPYMWQNYIQVSIVCTALNSPIKDFVLLMHRNLLIYQCTLLVFIQLACRIGGRFF